MGLHNLEQQIWAPYIGTPVAKKHLIKNVTGFVLFSPAGTFTSLKK